MEVKVEISKFPGPITDQSYHGFLSKLDLKLLFWQGSSYRKKAYNVRLTMNEYNCYLDLGQRCNKD